MGMTREEAEAWRDETRRQVEHDTAIITRAADAVLVDRPEGGMVELWHNAAVELFYERLSGEVFIETIILGPVGLEKMMRYAFYTGHEVAEQEVRIKKCTCRAPGSADFDMHEAASAALDKD